MRLQPRTSTTAYRGGITIGPLADHWGKDTALVKGLIEDGLLQTTELGLITNSSLRTYYREHGSPRG